MPANRRHHRPAPHRVVPVTIIFWVKLSLNLGQSRLVDRCAAFEGLPLLLHGFVATNTDHNPQRRISALKGLHLSHDPIALFAVGYPVARVSQIGVLPHSVAHLGQGARAVMLFC